MKCILNGNRLYGIRDTERGLLHSLLLKQLTLSDRKMIQKFVLLTFIRYKIYLNSIYETFDYTITRYKRNSVYDNTLAAIRLSRVDAKFEPLSVYEKNKNGMYAKNSSRRTQSTLEWFVGYTRASVRYKKPLQQHRLKIKLSGSYCKSVLKF